MALTLAQIFGTNVEVDDTTPSDLKIVKAINDYQNTPNGDLDGNGIDSVASITSLNINNYAEKIFLGDIFRILKNQASTDTNPDVGIYINPTFTKGFVVRGGESQLRVAITIYAYFPDTITPDLDNVITA